MDARGFDELGPLLSVHFAGLQNSFPRQTLPIAGEETQSSTSQLSKKEQRKLEKQKQTQETKEPQDLNIFGDLPRVQSQQRSNRVWTEIKDISASKDGEEVLVRARLHTVRGKGKLAFLVLRQSFSTIQAVLVQSESVPKAMVKFATSIPTESIVEIVAKVARAETPIVSCSQSDAELQISKIYTISRALPLLPFQLEDASRPDSAFDANPDLVRVNLDTRLNNRIIDARTPANQAILRIQSAVCFLFREFLVSQGFVEIHSPKIIGGTSEGGSEVFRFNYFDRDACLAQSPQLYKQMAAVGCDLSRVFEIGPVFRAENSNTHRHLCEFTGLDLEMEIKEHYDEALEVIGNVFIHIFDGLNERFSSELNAVDAQHPFEPFKYLKPTLKLPFPEGIQMLRDAGVEIGDFDDLSTANERILGRLVKDKYDTDFYILDRFPTAARPFYTMPDPEDPNYTNSYDIFMRGEEIVSGAQRIHDPDLLAEMANRHQIPLHTIQPYIDSFKYGAVPHAGCGIGLERVVMLFLGLDNIRKACLFPRDPSRLQP